MHAEDILFGKSEKLDGFVTLYGNDPAVELSKGILLKIFGLKDNLLDATLQASADAGLPEPPDLSDGSYGERLAHYQAEAIINFMKESEFTITELKAPVVVESIKTPDQLVNVELDTLLGPYAPVLKTLRKISH